MQEMKAYEADIPQNIKWEKRNRKGLQRCMDLFRSWALIGVLATTIFGLIFFVRYKNQALEKPFDMLSQCDARGINPFQSNRMNYLANHLFNVSGDRYSNLFADRHDVFELEIINCYCQLKFSNMTYKYKTVDETIEKPKKPTLLLEEQEGKNDTGRPAPKPVNNST